MIRTRWTVPAVILAALATTPAAAVDERVKQACKDDYFKHCSAHAVGSQELRTCMRKVDKNLSRTCVDALVAAGEVSAKEVERRRALAR